MPLTVNFTQWELRSGEPTGPIRLVAAPGGITLYRSVTGEASADIKKQLAFDYQVELYPDLITGDRLPLITIPQSLPNIAAFDIARTPDNQLRILLEAFGGASNALLFGNETRGQFEVTAPYDDGRDYRFPRFFRGDLLPPGNGVSSIVDRDLLAAMKPDPLKLSPTVEPYYPMAIGQVGIVIADNVVATARGIARDAARSNGVLPPPPMLAGLIKEDSDFLKDDSIGIPPSPAGDAPGTLWFQHTVGQGGSSRRDMLFDKDECYAFDADCLTGTMVVVASTYKGPQLLAWDLASSQATPLPWPTGYPQSGTWISSPTVAGISASGSAKVFSLAFFEGHGEGDTATVAGIRYGQVSLA